MSQNTRTSLTTIRGVIRRRILLNYAVQPDDIQRLLPAPFRPKLHAGHAVAGICMIRLEQMRPRWAPSACGISSENAAHRIAVEWTDENGETKEGVYIPRRDTGSRMNYWAGGRLFPGEHHLARFSIDDSGDEISFAMDSEDGSACIDLKAAAGAELPNASIFSSVAAASQFFEGGCDGFSPRLRSSGIDAMRLCIGNWAVQPLEVIHAKCAWFDDESIFPPGCACLDHALLMRDIEHEWRNTTVPHE